VNFQGDGVENPLDFATVVSLAYHIDGNGSGLKEYSEKVLEFLSDACYTNLNWYDHLPVIDPITL